MQIGVSNPNVPIFPPRVCTLVLFIIYVPINVREGGEVRHSWGSDLIRIQLPHPPATLEFKSLPRTRDIHTGSDGI